MITIPITYSLRNLWTRRLTTLLTGGGIAMVIFVFAAVLMLAYGLEKTLVATGSDDNAIVIRRGSQSEMMSLIDRTAANVIRSSPRSRPAPMASRRPPRRRWSWSACRSGERTNRLMSRPGASRPNRWRCARRSSF